MQNIWSNLSLKGAEFNVTSSVSSFRNIKNFEKILINSQKKLKVSFDVIFFARALPLYFLLFYVSLELLRYRMHWEVKGISKGKYLTKTHFQLFFRIYEYFLKFFDATERGDAACYVEFSTFQWKITSNVLHTFLLFFFTDFASANLFWENHWRRWKKQEMHAPVP